MHLVHLTHRNVRVPPRIQNEKRPPAGTGRALGFHNSKGITVDMLLDIDRPKSSGNDDEDMPQASARERNWLAARLARGKRERFSDIVLVTPGIAAAMLLQNIGNRPITRSQVEAHKRRLVSGDFKLTHHGISFANTGVLNDGQHRLTAIVESGIPGELQITFGADREEFGLIDQGRKRSASDMLAIAGKPHTALRASVAAALLAIAQPNSKRCDAQQVFDYAVKIASNDMERALTAGQNLGKVCQPTAVTLAHYWIAKHSKHADRLPEFFMNLSDGQNLAGAKLKLREFLKDRSNLMTSNGRDGNVKRAAIIIFAWNAFILNKRAFEKTWVNVVKLPAPL